MSLPDLTKELKYTTKELPSGRKMKFAGWKVKDKRELLLKLDSAEGEVENLTAVKDLAKSCVGKDAKLIDELSELDLRFLVIEMRKIAEGTTIDFVFDCPHCQHPNEGLYIDLNKDLELRKFNGATVVTDDFRFDLQEVPALLYRQLEDKHGDDLDAFNFAFIANTISSVTYKDKVYPNFTPKELEEWLGTMEMKDLKDAFAKINEQAGYLRINKIVKCQSCEDDVIVVFKEPTSFFVR